MLRLAAANPLGIAATRVPATGEVTSTPSWASSTASSASADGIAVAGRSPAARRGRGPAWPRGWPGCRRSAPRRRCRCQSRDRKRDGVRSSASRIAPAGKPCIAPASPGQDHRSRARAGRRDRRRGRGNIRRRRPHRSRSARRCAACQAGDCAERPRRWRSTAGSVRLGSPSSSQLELQDVRTHGVVRGDQRLQLGLRLRDDGLSQSSPLRDSTVSAAAWIAARAGDAPALRWPGRARPAVRERSAQDCGRGFIEVPLHQGSQRVDRRLRRRAFGLHLQHRAGAQLQRHDLDDALGVDPLRLPARRAPGSWRRRFSPAW